MRTESTCYCFTCGRTVSSLGIASHRAMHRRKHEDCDILYSKGTRYVHRFSKLKAEQ